jgi:hypothetical protein
MTKSNYWENWLIYERYLYEGMQRGMSKGVWNIVLFRGTMYSKKWNNLSLFLFFFLLSRHQLF